MDSYPKDQELNKENTIASQNAVNNSSAADCWDCCAIHHLSHFAILCFTEEAIQRETRHYNEVKAKVY